MYEIRQPPTSLCLQPSTSSYHLQLPHGRYGHHGPHGHGGHVGCGEHGVSNLRSFLAVRYSVVKYCCDSSKLVIA